MFDPKEDNRNKRRDKKFQKKKSGMIVSEAGRRLAEILSNLRRRTK